MAGFYPDVPGNRFAYHQDGTQAYLKDDATNTMTAISTASLSLMNDEDGDSVAMGSGWAGNKHLIFIFPEPRNFTGYYVNSNETTSQLQVSSDTTNGLDGTWTSVSATWTNDGSGNPIPGYRTNPRTVAGGTVKAISFALTSGNFNPIIYCLHLYGSIPLTSNPDRLVFWEPINDNATAGAYFDWGDIAQGTSRTKQFRIKNNSSTKIATSITLASTAVTAGMTVQFSADDVNYSTSINIGDLAAGATSSVLYVKRSVPANEPMQMQACYFTANAASWA